MESVAHIVSEFNRLNNCEKNLMEAIINAKYLMITKQ